LATFFPVKNSKFFGPHYFYILTFYRLNVIKKNKKSPKIKFFYVLIFDKMADYEAYSEAYSVLETQPTNLAGPPNFMSSIFVLFISQLPFVYQQHL